MPFPGRGRGSEASQLGAESRIPFIRVAERLPRVHASAHPHPALPHPGETGRGPEPRDPGRARSALSPPRAFSSRLGPGGHASPTPAARAAAAQRARLWGRAPGPGGGPGTRGRGRGRQRAASRRTRSAPRTALPSTAGRTLAGFPGKGEGAGFALLRAGRSFLWQLLCTRVHREPAAPRGQPQLQAALQRETRGHALPRLLSLLDARLSAAARVLPQRWNCAPPAPRSLRGQRQGGDLWGASGCWPGGRRNGLGRGQGTKASEGGASITQKGREEKAICLPEGIRREEGRKGSGEYNHQRRTPHSAPRDKRIEPL